MSKIGTMIAAVLILIAPLAAQTVTVNSPNGGETLELGSSCSISWATTGVSGNVKIQLRRPGGAIVGVIAPGVAHDASPYTWTVGQTNNGTADAGNYRICVMALDGSASDVSNANFALAAAGSPEPEPESGPAPRPRLRIVKPNEGGKLKQGSRYNIGWESEGVSGSLRLVLFKGKGKGRMMDIARDLPASQKEYEWVAGLLANGDMAPAGEEYFICIEAAGGPSDFCDKPFAIAKAEQAGSGVSITVQGNSFVPGGRLTFTYQCGCGFPTGANENIDSIFLNRQAWGWEVNQWQAMGKITRDTTSGSKTISVPTGLEQADDWVITIWWGDRGCWGQSAPFSIRRPAGSRVLVFPYDGETLYREWDTAIRWDATSPNWDRVKIELLKGGRVVQVLRSSATKGIQWRIGTETVWDQDQSTPDDTGSYGSYADGSDFRIRLTDRDTGETEESGFFSIATPRIAILVPSGPGHFKRGNRIMISWRGYHLPPRVTRVGVSIQMCPDGEYRAGFGLPGSCYPNCTNMYGVSEFAILRDDEAAEGNFSWLVPVEGEDCLWPKTDCDPVQIRISIRCTGGSHIGGTSSVLTIEHD
jgi:hypothetical protein